MIKIIIRHYVMHPTIWSYLIVLYKRNWVGKQMFWQPLAPGGLLYRAVASLEVLGGQEFHTPNSVFKFRYFFLNSHHILLIFVLNLALRVGPLAHPERPWLRHCYCTSVIGWVN